MITVLNLILQLTWYDRIIPVKVAVRMRTTDVALWGLPCKMRTNAAHWIMKGRIM